MVYIMLSCYHYTIQGLYESKQHHSTRVIEIKGEVTWITRDY